MSITPFIPHRPGRLQRAYTMIEVLIGVTIMGIAFVSLYAGLSGGFAITQLSRENLRATQIILERMEGLRLYNWDQLTTSNSVYPGYLPTAFTNHYYPITSPGQGQGIAYRGQMIISPADPSPSATYSSDMRKITVSVAWESGGVTRNRAMTTYASRHGMQNYVYSN